MQAFADCFLNIKKWDKAAKKTNMETKQVAVAPEIRKISGATAIFPVENRFLETKKLTNFCSRYIFCYHKAKKRKKSR